MKNRMITWALAALLAQAAQAEMRIWTGNTGSQLTAEFVAETAGKVVLRDETGRELKIPRSFLSPADIEYLDSRIVPVLGIQPDIKVESVFKPDSGVVQVVKYSIEIRKVSSPPYESPMNVALYLIGAIGDDKAHVVLQRTRRSRSGLTPGNVTPGSRAPTFRSARRKSRKSTKSIISAILLWCPPPAGGSSKSSPTTRCSRPTRASSASSSPAISSVPT